MLLLLFHRLLFLLGLLVLHGGLLSLLLRCLLLVLDFFLLLHCLLLLFGLRDGLLDAGRLLAFSLLRIVAAGDGQQCGSNDCQRHHWWGEDAYPPADLHSALVLGHVVLLTDCVGVTD